MSYRAFKRLLGETSLERKCRFLFGMGILVLITLSFWVYAIQTEGLAYDQAKTTCRMLINPILDRHHAPFINAKRDEKGAIIPSERGRQLQEALDLADKMLLKEQNKDYQYVILQESKIEDSFERDLLKDFRRDESRHEESRLRPNEQVLMYYAPVRLNHSCMKCHQQSAEAKGMPAPAEHQLVGMVRIRMPTKAIEEGVHWNRAVLMGIALATAICIMAGSWIIV